MQGNDWLDRPMAVRPGEELDTASLERYLRRQLPSAEGKLELKQYPGGYSNLTYSLRLGDRELVLRRPPFGVKMKAAHDMGREYRILSALVTAYAKVPRPLLYCDDEAVIGSPFYVMERVDGIILRDSLPQGLQLAPQHMREICLALVDTLVELHDLDYQAAGLADLGRPEGYVARQVSGWARRYERARTDHIPAMEQLARWLQEHLPTHSDATLIHNDYRYDNVVLDADDLTSIRAVLDWELATLGDPLTDVGTTLAYWAEPGDPPTMQRFAVTTLPGNLDRRQLVERYAAQSRRNAAHILFYYIYGLFKNAVILQQIYYRYCQGLTQDKRFASLLDIVRDYSRMAMLAIDKDRIDHLFD